MQTIYLKKGHERRVKLGHDWIFSNEIDNQRCSLFDMPLGGDVSIHTAQGTFLGHAYANANSLICARIYSRHEHEILNTELILQRLQQALLRRERLFPQPYYRLCYGESDALPGLVIDRFGDVVVMQINTLGMQVRQDMVCHALQQLLAPTCIIAKNNHSTRKLEGLDEHVLCIDGQPPQIVHMQENGASFTVDVINGQKTGWFFDHRMNRRFMQKIAKSSRVLDLFCYSGAWGIQALIAGAKELVCVDSSMEALKLASHHAQINQVSHCMTTLCLDAFDALKLFHTQQEKFDLVIVDPPAFAKKKKDIAQGLMAYQRLNELASSVLNENGVLVSASCSYHIAMPQFVQMISKALHKNRLRGNFIQTGWQSPDHPVHAFMPETHYLKAVFFQKS